MEKKTKNEHNKTNNKQNERRCRGWGEGEKREEMGSKKPGDTVTKLEDLKMVTLEQLKKPLCMLAIAYR